MPISSVSISVFMSSRRSLLQMVTVQFSISCSSASAASASLTAVQDITTNDFLNAGITAVSLQGSVTASVVPASYIPPPPPLPPPSPTLSVSQVMPGSSSGGGVGVIAGAVGGGGCGMAVLVAVWWFCIRRRRCLTGPAAMGPAQALRTANPGLLAPSAAGRADRGPATSAAVVLPPPRPRADSARAKAPAALQESSIARMPPALPSSSAPVSSPRAALSSELQALLQAAGLEEYAPQLLDKGLGVRTMADAQMLLEQSEAVAIGLLQSSAGMSLMEAMRLLKALRAEAARGSAPQAAKPLPHRVRALVVGCGAYALLEDLDNPQQDAAAIAALLEAAGAEVLLLLNPTRMELDYALRTLSDVQRKPFPQALVEAAKTRRASLKHTAPVSRPPPPPPDADADVIGLLFFAGHGMEISGENLLVPSDFTLDADILKGSTTLSETQVQTLVRQSCVSIREALDHMSSADFYVALALLDCCRDWPLPSLLPKTRGARTTRGGMATVEASALTAREGAIIGFATKDGEVALDDAKLRPGHSPFTAALMEHLARTDLPLAMLIPEVTDSVMKDTHGKQACLRARSRRAHRFQARCFLRRIRMTCGYGLWVSQVPELKTSGLGKTGASLCLFAAQPYNC